MGYDIVIWQQHPLSEPNGSQGEVLVDDKLAVTFIGDSPYEVKQLCRAFITGHCRALGTVEPDEICTTEEVQP